MVANDNLTEKEQRARIRSQSLDPAMMAAVLTGTLDAKMHPEVAVLFVLSAFLQKPHLPVVDFVRSTYQNFFNEKMNMDEAISRCVLNQSDYAEIIISSDRPEVTAHHGRTMFEMLEQMHAHYPALFPAVLGRCTDAFSRVVDGGSYNVLVALDEMEHHARLSPIHDLILDMRRSVESHTPHAETVARPGPSRS